MGSVKLTPLVLVFLNCRLTLCLYRKDPDLYWVVFMPNRLFTLDGDKMKMNREEKGDKGRGRHERGRESASKRERGGLQRDKRRGRQRESRSKIGKVAERDKERDKLKERKIVIHKDRERHTNTHT